MRKPKPIKIVVHMPEDRAAFEKKYVEAVFDALKQLAHTAPNKQYDNASDKKHSNIV